MTVRAFLHGLTVGALLLSGGALPSAQGRPGVAREVDPTVVRARDAIGHGRYAEAETLLTPAVAAAPTGDAALELGLLQLYLGRRDDGVRTLTRLVDGVRTPSAADLLRLGRAAYALGRVDEANGFFRDANRAAPNDPDINAAWGTLFLEKNELQEAQRSFAIVLERQPTNAAALVGMARAVMDTNPPAAEKSVEIALESDPSYVPAHLLLAEQALDDRRRDDAKASIAKALEVNPNSLEARSLEAAMAFLEDRKDDFERMVQAALAINPVYGEIYRVAGDQVARNYRFEEAVPLTRKALALDPGNAQANADLGMELLRLGDEKAARVALEASVAADPFYSSNVTNNLLTMLDKVDTFETIEDGNLIVRLAPEEAGVMREQVLPLAHEALDTLAKRWDFTPVGPILIEMFPVHDDFAVRTLGLPGMIGALGVCFGKVVAVDSPHARPPGEYNWQPTLWHELAHVITLQMSGNRLPRWLSEGISMWEEKRGRPEWGWESDVEFAHAMDQKRILSLASLNDGFSDPEFISLAYYEASLAVEHFVERFGEPALHTLVRSYARGIETDQAIKEAFGETLDQIQVTFDAKLDQQYRAVRQALERPDFDGEPTVADLEKLASSDAGSFPVQMALGAALDMAGDADGAIRAYERASALIPRANGDGNPNKAIAAVALKKGDTARAIRALEDVVHVDHADVESARKLASLLAPTGDAARTEDAYARLTAVDPFDGRAQAELGRLAMRRKDAPVAIRAFRSALATNPSDAAAAHVDLAEAYVLAGQLPAAKQQTLAALEIAPAFERAQDLLLTISESTGRQ